mgnify:CR=1 FL=1
MSNVRFGLIGYGAWGGHHANAIAKTTGAELVAIAARSEDSCQRAKSDFPSASIYNDYNKLLESENLDVVDIVLPSHLHLEASTAALSSGRHLLLEKPMALSVSDCESLIRLAKEKDRILAVGHELRLSSMWAKVKEMVDEGAIGTPLYVLIELWRRPYRHGAEGWRYDINRVGNWILEEPIHFFDLARWYLSQLGDPISVYACANSRQEGHPELQDNFSSMLHFRNGAYAVITQTLRAFEHHQTAKLTGTKGALWASWSGAQDRTLHPTFSLKYHEGESVEEIPIEKITGEVFELEDQMAMMVKAVRDGAPVAADGVDGMWSVKMCEAAKQSVDRGEVVTLQS